MVLFQYLVSIQRDIYLAFADKIGIFARTGDWSLLAAYLPMGTVFGAVHAMTPGHSKAVLATLCSSVERARFLIGQRTSRLGSELSSQNPHPR